ncbi:MAG: twin-arginine translocase TatA/TatE family subunit [Candidatus Poseidoniales archaeon]
MNAPGLIELLVILFLVWAFLGPQKVMEGARTLGKTYREFRGYSTNLALGVEGVSEIEKVRASAERLGIDTAGMDLDEIKNAMVEKLSNE